MTDLSDLSLPELRKLASDNDIRLKSRTKKEIRKELQRAVDKGKLTLKKSEKKSKKKSEKKSKKKSEKKSKKKSEKIDIVELEYRYVGNAAYQDGIDAFDELSPEEKFDVLRQFKNVKGCGTLCFDLIAGYPAMGGESIYSLYNTMNVKTDPRIEKATGEVYRGQRQNIKDLSGYLGIPYPAKKGGLLRNQVVELLWWFVYGDFEFDPDTMPDRMTQALKMEDEDLEDILRRSKFKGNYDRTLMAFVYATGYNPWHGETQFGKTEIVTAEKHYDSVIKADKTTIYMYLKFSGILFDFPSEGPFRTFSRLFKTGYAVDKIINLTLKNSNDYAERYGTMIVPADIYNVTNANDDMRNVDTGFAALVHYFVNDFTEVLEERDKGEYVKVKASDKRAVLIKNNIDVYNNYTTYELVRGFNADYTVAMDMLLKAIKRDEDAEGMNLMTNIREEVIELIGRNGDAILNWTYILDPNGGKGFFMYGSSTGKHTIPESMLAAEVNKSSSTGRIKTGIQGTIEFDSKLGVVKLGKYFSEDDIIEIAKLIRRVNGTSNPKYYAKNSYEIKLFKLSNIYSKQKKLKSKYITGFNGLDDKNKIFFINFFLWCINAGTKSYTKLKEVYLDLVDVANADAFEPSRNLLLELNVPTGTVEFPQLTAKNIDALNRKVMAKLDNVKLILYGEIYLAIIGYNRTEIDNMLSHYRKA